MLSIGSFSLVTGLSITALRHYDDVGLLKPAYVDPGTGYRRYRPDQIDEARLYATLRRLRVPVDAMRAVREHGVGNPESHPWPGGPAKFGLGVEDIDAAQMRIPPGN